MQQVDFSDRYISQCKSNRFAEMWSGAEEGSNSRLMDFCNSILGTRVIMKQKGEG